MQNPFCTAYASLECTNVIPQCLIAGSDRLCYSQGSRRAIDLKAKVFNHLRSLVTSSALSYSSRLDVHIIFPASQRHFRVEAIVTDAILVNLNLLNWRPGSIECQSLLLQACCFEDIFVALHLEVTGARRILQSGYKFSGNFRFPWSSRLQSLLTPGLDIISRIGHSLLMYFLLSQGLLHLLHSNQLFDLHDLPSN